jgi:NAD(P)-dependent dehydrogenase (short-subunit alcohol dehydrogenase family)
VVLFARTDDSLRDAASTLGAHAHAISMDVTDPASVRAAFGRIEERFGRLDALVNNAAVAWPARLEHTTDEQLIAQLHTNLLGPMLTIRSAIPLLRKAPAGHIVNVSSESAHEPFPLLGPYAATKAGLEVLSQALVHELAGDGIRVTLLCSGRTSGGGFTAGWGDDVRAAAYATWEAGGYIARVAGIDSQAPERIAEAVRFVVDQPADSMIDVIHVRARPGG